jgi:hypothetical protein
MSRPGAAKITYNIKSVSRDASKHPSIVFQFQKVRRQRPM